jgi:cytochrome c-type biogenesis protein
MIPLDLAYGFLAGVLSCLTPEALLLLPLLPGAAGAVDRAGVIALALGLGLSLVLTGLIAGSLGALFRFDAIWLRRAVCVALFLQGLALMTPSMVERFPLLTGGLGVDHGMAGGISVSAAFRQFLLGLFVGANWIPKIGPTLGKASLMAADMRNIALALCTLFVFGLAAGVPWIVAGRILRLTLRPVAWRLFDGMAGKRILGLTLLAVAVLGGSGLELAMVRWIDPMLPVWATKLALMF